MIWGALFQSGDFEPNIKNHNNQVGKVGKE